MKKNLFCILVILSIFAWANCDLDTTGKDQNIADIKKEPKRGEVRPHSKEKMLPAYMTEEELRIEQELRNSEVINLRTVYDNAPSGNVYAPAEFSTMSAVLVRVPNYNTDFDNFFRKLIAAIIKAGATPYIVATNTSDANDINNYVLRPESISTSKVKFVYTENEAIWSRDYGPWNIYIDGQRAIVDNKYYSDRPNDDYIPILLGNEYFNEDVFKTTLYLEGGNFMTDGLGTCFTTTGLFRRNLITKAAARRIYRDYLGCENTYFPDPLNGEGTTHIDMFSKILNQDTIMVSSSTSSLGANSKELASLRNAVSFYENTPKPDGGSWNIVRVPMTFGTHDKRRVQYSHTNATIINKTAIIPIYNRGTDEEAIRKYKEAMPGYEIIPVLSTAPIVIGGAVHCTTMQIPVKTYRSCGDGVVTGSEECDMYLNNKTCSDLGYSGGTLSCTGSCTFDTSDCSEIIVNPLGGTHSWNGNGSIISHSTGSLKGAGLTYDVSRIHPGSENEPVVFFQWEVSKYDGTRIKISTENNTISKATITYGTWSARNNDRTYKEVDLPFVLDPAKDNFSTNSGNWYVIKVAFNEKPLIPVTVRAEITSDPALSAVSESSFEDDLDEKNQWNGNGSVISYSTGTRKGYGITQDVARIHPYSEKNPSVFFQWEVDSRDGEKLVISSSSSQARTATITYGSWSSRDNDVSKKVTLPYTIDPVSDGYVDINQNWFVIKVDFNFIPSSSISIEAEIAK